MNSVLVTGGCGYIGSHTVLSLLEKGYKVYVLDSFINSSPLVIKRLLEMHDYIKFKVSENLHFIEGDLRSSKDLEKVFLNAIKDGNEIKAVIHFAGLKSVKDSFKEVITYWDFNLAGTINLLKVMNSFSCRTLIFSSSATIYSYSEEKALKENSLIKPINPYGLTKATIEVFLQDIYSCYPDEWRIVNLRYFNPIGAHVSGKLGEDPIGNPTNIFPLILNVASKEISKLKVYGNNWNTKDGTCIRDYIHVMDLAEGHVAALNFLESNSSRIINLNIGTGIGSSVLELINIFQDVNNIEVPYEISERREGDQENVVADNTKILSTLNWQPKRSVENMCEDGWRWKLLNPKGYK